MEGEALLLQAARRQKEHLLDHYRFARRPDELHYAVPAYSRNGHYRLEIVRADQGRYLMRAVPRLTQAGDRCGALEITESGRKRAGNGATDCW